MSLKSRIFLVLSILFIGIGVIIYYYIDKTYKRMNSNFVFKNYERRVSEYNYFFESKKNFLLSLAKLIVNKKDVIKGYLENNRELIINSIKPIWKNFNIYELHFFKPPNISFVNFSNLNRFGFNVNVRSDIKYSINYNKPSEHFLVCRAYPGYRITYPIKYKNKILGAVSIGIYINALINYFNKLDVKGVGIYLNDDLLRNHLLPINYQKLIKKYKRYGDYILIGEGIKNNLFKIFSRRFYREDNNLYTIIKMKNFDNKLFGYLILKDKYSKILKEEAQLKRSMLLILLIGLLMLFLVVTYLFKIIFSKVEEIKNIAINIKNRNFNKLPSKNELLKKDIFEELKYNIINMGYEIKNYFEILNEKIEMYKNEIYIDTLTKAFNRKFLQEYEINLAGKEFSILYLDIDHFKKINDTYGHDFGDYVLKEFVKILRNNLRKDDLIIRLGGEEFLVILENIDKSKALKIAEKIRKTVEAYNFNGKKITVSIGVADVFDDKDLKKLIKKADKMLYLAKNRGRNRVEVFRKI